MGTLSEGRDHRLPRSGGPAGVATDLGEQLDVVEMAHVEGN